MSDLDLLVRRAEAMLARLETLIPAVAAPDWSASVAFRWRRRALRWDDRLRQDILRRHLLGLHSIAHHQRCDQQRRKTRTQTHGWHPAKQGKWPTPYKCPKHPCSGKGV